jgi:hypothetical protein
MWCSGRDSDPGLRLERPEYLTGLYYRSAFYAKVSCKCFSTRINLTLLFIGTTAVPTCFGGISSKIMFVACLIQI